MLSQRSPDQINAARAETDRAARDKYASERESYRAEAEQDAVSEDERLAFQAGHKIGERTERARIKAALDVLERKAASLFFEGTPSQRAVACYLAEARLAVEDRS